MTITRADILNELAKVAFANVTPADRAPRSRAAARMRRHRDRRRDGLRCLTIELRETEIAELISERGFFLLMRAASKQRCATRYMPFSIGP